MKALEKLPGLKQKGKPAFFYCITEETFHTVKIDKDQMTVGSAKDAAIFAPLAWLPAEAGQAGRDKSGRCLFCTAPESNVLLNGEKLQTNRNVILEDRDALLFRGREEGEWLLLWLRENEEEMTSAWNVKSAEEAMQLLYPDGTQKEWTPGYTAVTDEISGVFTREKFYYQMIGGASTGGTTVSEEVASTGVLSIDIESRDVQVFLKKKTILRDIHLDIRAGEMVLVLGGSGAGKTTFMNAVIGHEKAKGTIAYNGKPMEELRKDGGGIGFVPQENILRPGDRVGMTIRNAAQMKLPESVQDDPEELNGRIRHTLQLMGLTEKEKELVSKLSGGEKKRLSVAGEYIGNPMLFFLDEPDSGLDGMQAKNLMQVLRSIADEGRIVMIISHSPDRGIKMFDKVIVLGKDKKRQCGELAFYGSPEKAMSFFGADDLEGIMDALGVAGQDRAGEFIEKYRELQPGRGGLT